jgi:glutamate transport system substrate-binding protein
MSTRRMGAAAATAALALTLAACGSDAGDTGSGGSGSGGSSAAGASGLKVGIKFDQPGLGLKKGSEYTGFDVDVATYIAKELGTDAANITWVQAPSAQRETLLSTGQVDMVVATYSITDARKEKVSFAGPYFIAGQDLLVRADDTSITGPETLKGKKLCSVTGSTSAQKVKDAYPGVQLQEFATYSECLPALANKGVDALTTDDTILAGFASQPEYAGKFKVVGKPFSEEKYGVGLKKGDTATCEKVNAAISKMVADGSWQKALDANLGPAGYKPGTGNPPTPAACS